VAIPKPLFKTRFFFFCRFVTISFASTLKEGYILVNETIISSNGERQLHDRWIVDSGATWHMTSN